AGDIEPRDRVLDVPGGLPAGPVRVRRHDCHRDAAAPRAGHDLQHQTLPSRCGAAMTAITDTTVKPKPRTTSERLARFVSQSPTHIILGLIGLVWLVPSVGLLITSFRPSADMRATGWWTVLFEPRFTISNYERVFEAEGMGQAFLNSLFITIPATFLPLVIASMA